MTWQDTGMVTLCVRFALDRADMGYWGGNMVTLGDVGGNE